MSWCNDPNRSTSATITQMASSNYSTSLNRHLCQKCRAIFHESAKISYPESIWHENGASGRRRTSKEEQELQVLPHWPNVYDFADSATSGCHICRLLWLQLTKDERTRIANRQFERKQGTFCLRRELNQNKATYNLAVGYNLGSNFRSMELQMDPSSGQ